MLIGWMAAFTQGNFPLPANHFYPGQGTSLPFETRFAFTTPKSA